MKKNEENKRCHLSMIQTVINRMGTNSFLLKGWAVGIMIAIYALANKKEYKVVIITLIPLLVIWMLDTYYLMLERKFRALYDNVRNKDEKDIDFSMNFNNTNIKMSDADKYCFFKIMFSKSIFPFYLVCMATTLIVYFKLY